MVQATLDILPTMETLLRRYGIDGTNGCEDRCICGEKETLEHALNKCSYTEDLRYNGEMQLMLMLDRAVNRSTP